ncbi:MAG: nuclear transport factor 2 family protein [Bacteroidota bacterium]|nr:nuclear transport factor 2 family protein [Bacteroidota bacterium]
MKAIIYLLFVAAVLFSCKGKDKDKDKKNEYPELAKKQLNLLNQQYDSALINSDTAMLNKIYASEFSYTTPEGQVRNRSQQLTTIGSGGLNLDYGKSDEVEIIVYDSTAIVTGRFMGKGIFKENIIDIKERYTTVWIKRNGEWKLVKEQGTFIQ